MFKNYNYRPKKIRKKKKVYNNARKYNIKKNTNSSKLEKFFEEYILQSLDIKYKDQKKITSKYYDFYLPEYNLLIEVDGDYYHAKDRSGELNEMQVKNIMNDHKKNLIAKQKGYNIIRFWESDIKDKTLSVKKELKEELEKLSSDDN